MLKKDEIQKVIKKIDDEGIDSMLNISGVNYYYKNNENPNSHKRNGDYIIELPNKKALSIFVYSFNKIKDSTKTSINESIKDVNANFSDLSKYNQELESIIDTKIESIEAIISEKFKELSRLIIEHDLVNTQLKKLQKIKEIYSFNINSILENTTINDSINYSNMLGEYNQNNGLYILDVKLTEHWSLYNKNGLIDIKYNFYIKYMNRPILIKSVKTVKGISSASKYIENLKKRYSKYFDLKIAKVPANVLEVLHDKVKIYEECEDEFNKKLINMGYVLVDKL